MQPRFDGPLTYADVTELTRSRSSSGSDTARVQAPHLSSLLAGLESDTLKPPPDQFGPLHDIMNEVTTILSALEQGDSNAAEQLLPLVYDELRKLAAQKLAQEKPGQTLQATALVHEAYLRLAGVPAKWDCRGHFFAAAAEAMRRILVDTARRKKSEKKGGAFERIRLDIEDLPQSRRGDKLVRLDEALVKLEVKNPIQAKLVKLRFFAGLTIAQTATALGISTATADRYWTYARAWLQREMASAEQ
jgi:RNA polymerase sigma factor (TIGR02999 family)